MFHFRKRYQTWPHYSNQSELYRELFTIFNLSYPEVNELKFIRNLALTFGLHISNACIRAYRDCFFRNIIDIFIWIRTSTLNVTLDGVRQ